MAKSSISIEINGLAEVMSKLKTLSAQEQQKAEQGVKNAGFYIQSEVQKSIAGQRAEPRSVDTGRFLNSVKTVFPKKFEAKVETNVSYAPTLEYGGAGRAPRSHFRNTAAREQNNVKNIISKELQ